MSLKSKLDGPLPVTAPLVLNPLMARMVEAAGFGAGYLGGGSSGYQKVALEANLNLTEMCQTAGPDAHASHDWHERGGRLRSHRNRGSAGAQAGAPSHARTNAMRASNLDDALRRGEAYRKAGADLLLSMAHQPEQLRAIGERLGGPLMYLAGRGGLAGSGMTLQDLGSLGFKIVADPGTALLAAFAAWNKVYQDLADGFGAHAPVSAEWPQPSLRAAEVGSSRG
jgi:methylisocitrate lyase